MSVEIWQFPRRGTRHELVASLRSLGFTVGKNLFWPGPRGTVSLFWADPTEFKSTSGVDASLFPLDSQGQGTWCTRHNLGLRTRTSIWASSFDRAFQNAACRHIRQRFGGFFINDHYGRNRYNVFASEKSTPASRGMYSVLTRVTGELDALERTLPEELIRSMATPQGDITPETDDSGILKVVKQADPSRVVYNALVPFLVATLEHFFRETFEILLRYHATALHDIQEQNRRIPFADAVAIARGQRSIEQVVSDWYSFQNLDSIQKAFKEVLGLDVWSLLRRRKKVRARLPLLSDAFLNLISARHGVVHYLSIDRHLDRDGFLNLLHLSKTIIEVVAKGLEKRLGARLGPG